MNCPSEETSIAKMNKRWSMDPNLLYNFHQIDPVRLDKSIGLSGPRVRFFPKEVAYCLIDLWLFINFFKDAVERKI